MTYRHVFVVHGAVDTIRTEVRKAKGKETGGPLVGYISDDRALVVTHAAGPGRRGKLMRSSVLIDGRDAQAFCDAMARLSGGRLDYIGDWHCHRARSLAPSGADREAMRLMAAFEYCPVRNPVSLIWRPVPEDYIVYTLTDEGELEFTPSSTLSEAPGMALSLGTVSNRRKVSDVRRGETLKR